MATSQVMLIVSVALEVLDYIGDLSVFLRILHNGAKLESTEQLVLPYACH